MGRSQAFGTDLPHQDDDPQHAARHVQAVRADQQEERRQECAAARAGAFCDQMVELVDFHADKRCTQQQGDAQPQHHLILAAVLQADHHHAVGDGRHQQDAGFDRHVRQIEEFLASRAAGRRTAQDAERGEQRREDDQVAHQVHPEAEDLGVCGIVVVRMVMRVVVAVRVTV